MRVFLFGVFVVYSSVAVMGGRDNGKNKCNARIRPEKGILTRISERFKRFTNKGKDEKEEK